MKNTMFILLGLLMFLSSCGEANKKTPTSNDSSSQNKSQVVKGQAYVAAVEGEEANALQVAMSLPDFSTLVTAITTAGVENAVVNTGPLTIFAPLNSAFGKLPEGTVASLLEPENKSILAGILINHVAPANYPIKQLKKEAQKGRKLYMASGQYLDVVADGDEISVGGTTILKTVKVSNGWIHVVDDVLVPVAQ